MDLFASGLTAVLRERTRFSVTGTSTLFLENIGIDGIVVERDNGIVDGAGYTLEGAEGRGIVLLGRSNVTIKNLEFGDMNMLSFSRALQTP